MLAAERKTRQSRTLYNTLWDSNVLGIFLGWAQLQNTPEKENAIKQTIDPPSTPSDIRPPIMSKSQSKKKSVKIRAERR